MESTGVNVEVPSAPTSSADPFSLETIERSEAEYNYVGKAWPNNRGNSLWSQRWIPKNSPPKALMFMCHGYADHLHGAVGDLCPRLAAKGYAVFGIEYEGCGRSTGVRAFHPDFKALVEDNYRFAKECQAEFPGLKSFFYGESMGGAIVIHLLSAHQNEFDGACLIAPMVKISEKTKPPELVVKLMKGIAKVFPQAAITPTADVIDHSYKEDAKRARVRSSPYAYNSRPRLRTAYELLEATNFIEKNMELITTPFIILHGGADTVNAIEGSREFVERAASTDKALKEYDGCWHAILGGESDETIEKIFGDMVSWLDERATK